ncbi:carboxypeptidase-like regulatory domain-containing protein [Rhodocaloribacter litoris]|uniref:TonB-dependent receptor n=1 Tax=Rhodocaloribacter litoris TaxID=2558931 RepID=UPI00141DE707|nr:TonB-dependent receptor [Rhodocaloribacter litoris]QXD16749.1 carboxypeptidase-like regulatory domain-containing protein [Rhodocaloribacter litoris]
MLRKWGTLVLLVLITPMLALAQNTGKLTGVVTDAETGDPLPGASVVLVGTQFGTITDVDGQYLLLGVPVGEYDVQVSFVGYQTVTQTGVEVNAGYTRELNFALRPGVELDEIVVEYERPLIQKDALGAPRVVTGEELQNLPVRGVATVASLQAGVVSNEGSSTLNIRGGRDEEVVYYVDGVKVVGNLGVAQQAIAEQEMLIGGLPAKYGDAMGGVISVSTKGGASRFFGSAEGITSQFFDDYEYNLGSVAIGGPVAGEKVSFFLSAEYQSEYDANPRAIPTPQLPDDRLEAIQNVPEAIQIQDASGNVRAVPVSAFELGQNGEARVSLADLNAQLGLGEGESVLNYDPVSVTRFFTEDDFEFRNARRNAENKNLNLNGNVSFSPSRSVRIRLGGQYVDRDYESYSLQRSIFSPHNSGQGSQQTSRVYLNWTHYLSAATFYQLQVDYTNYKFANWQNGFSDDIRDVLFYGDIDHPNNAVAARYRQFDRLEDTDGDGTPDTAVFVQQFEDGTFPGLSGVASQFAQPGAVGSGFSKGRSEQLRFSANVTTQLGIHQIEFGGEYEKRTQRYYEVPVFNFSGAQSLARFYDDGDIEGDVEKAVSRWDDFQFSVLDEIGGITYYGYDYRGLQEVDSEDLRAYTTGDQNAVGNSAFNIAPYEPIYYAGYISDKVEFRDIVLQVGVRVDVFDNNQRVLRDPYALVPIRRVADVGGAPENIGGDFAVYCTNGDCSSPDRVVGYRDLNGTFYNRNGQVVGATEVVTRGTPQLRDGFERNQLYEEVFTDYDPQVNFQPRIGVTFPVTDQALFFAHYDVLTQRPTTRQIATLDMFQSRLASSGSIGNPNLKPQKTIEYELGFRQRLGARAAIQISGFFRQIKDLIQLRALKNVFPNNYSTFQNVDFGTVKGAEFEFDLRRTGGVALNVSYTFSVARGTGSDATTTSNIFWLREANPIVPNFLSPLDFDRRHTAHVTLDYRLGAGEGPTIFGSKLLENFGVNIIGSLKSGQPYSRLLAPYPRHAPVRLTGLKGEINGENLPTTTLINLRLDRQFRLNDRTTLTAFLWIENLLDQDNVLDVWPATGDPDNDGYLETDDGLAEFPPGSSGRMYYQFRLRDPFNYGIPRQTRLGFRLNF